MMLRVALKIALISKTQNGITSLHLDWKDFLSAEYCNL